MLSLYAELHGYTITLDLHGMTVQQAKKELQSVLKECPKHVKEVEVIHGYHGGQALQQYVRSIKHPKVQRVIVGLNHGQTTLLLK